MAKKKQEMTAEEKLAAALVREEEQPYAVPGNWIWVRLGSVATIIGGGTPSSNVSEYYENGNVPWISPADLSHYTNIYISHGKKNITELGLKKSSARLMPRNTVMLSSRAPIGYVVIADNEIATNQGFKSFLPSSCYLPKYLYFYLKNNKELLESHASGTTFLELSGKNAALIEFPLPPLAEQQRIVDRIESLIDQLDQAKELIQAALDSFENRKAAILHQAFTGELTKKWRAAHGVGMESWEEIPFGAVVNNYDSKRIPLSRTQRENMHRNYDYYGASGIIDSVENYLFDKRLLLIGEDGANLVTRNKPIAFIAVGKYWVNNHAHVVDTKENMVLDFLCYFINWIDLIPYVTGSAQPKMTQAKLNTIPVKSPTLNEQHEIVRILDDLLAKEQNAKDLCDQIDQIEAIKKTILGKAFRGELGTNQDGEASARELLQQILSPSGQAK